MSVRSYSSILPDGRTRVRQYTRRRNPAPAARSLYGALACPGSSGLHVGHTRIACPIGPSSIYAGQAFKPASSCCPTTADWKACPRTMKHPLRLVLAGANLGPVLIDSDRPPCRSTCGPAGPPAPTALAGPELLPHGTRGGVLCKLYSQFSVEAS